MMVCCVFSLESPHRGDSYECTKQTIMNIKKESHPKLPHLQCLQLWNYLCKGLKNGIEKAVVNEPPVFEPLKFYCTYIHYPQAFKISFIHFYFTECLMCYQCADSSSDEDKNQCQTYIRTMRKYKRLFLENGNLGVYQISTSSAPNIRCLHVLYFRTVHRLLAIQLPLYTVELQLDQTLMAGLPCLTRTHSWAPMVPYM